MSDKPSTSHTFSCQNCGHPYTVYPPDSSYLYALMRPVNKTNQNIILNSLLSVKSVVSQTKCICPGHVYSTSSNLISG